MIPKPSQDQGLGIGWPAENMDKGELQKVFDDMKAKM